MSGLWGTGLKFATFVVASVLLLVLLLNTMLNGLGADARGFEAELTDVSGLRVGDDVKVAGVRVGRVSSIEASQDGAVVGFDLVAEQPILDTTRIVMRYQNLLGQRYLGLVQDGRRGAELQAGARVPLSMTDPGFDLTALLNGFRPLFDVLRPADVNELAASVVRVLQGESGTVESLLQQTTELTTFVADRDDLISDVLTSLTPVLQDLDAQGPELDATVAELRALMTGLARDRRAIGASIDGVGRLVDSTAGLLTDLRGPTVGAVRELAAVASLLSASRGDLTDAIASFGALFEGLGRSGSYENALNIYLCSLSFEIADRTVNSAGGPGPFSPVCR